MSTHPAPRHQGAESHQGVRLEGLRVMGDPYQFAVRYYEQRRRRSAWCTWTSSRALRPQQPQRHHQACRTGRVRAHHGRWWHPFGRMRCARHSCAGRDKAAINTAIARPAATTQVAQRPRLPGDGALDRGQAPRPVRSGRLQRQWAAKIRHRPRRHRAVGEARRGNPRGRSADHSRIDLEGTRKGFWISTPLGKVESEAVPVPVIASGGMGTLEHFLQAAKGGRMWQWPMRPLLASRSLSTARRRTTAGCC